MAEATKIIELVRKQRHMQLLEKASQRKINSREIKELEQFESSSTPQSESRPKRDIELIVYRQQEIATLFGVDVRTVANWVKDGMPVLGNERYHLPTIVQWYIERVKKSFERDNAGAWDEKYREMKAKEAELKYKKLVGELIPRAEVDSGNVKRVLAWKRAMQQIPRVVAPLCAGMAAREIEAIVQDQVNHILDTYAGAKRGTSSHKNTK